MWAASCLASCCAACACDACRTVVSGINRKSARISYCGLFALSLFVSWLLREFATPLMEKIPWINHFHQTPSKEWFQIDAVLRFSLGNFLFFYYDNHFHDRCEDSKGSSRQDPPWWVDDECN